MGSFACPDAADEEALVRQESGVRHGLRSSACLVLLRRSSLPDQRFIKSLASGGGTFNKFPPKVYPALKASFVNLSGRSPRRWAVIDLDVSRCEAETVFQNRENRH
ncbi:hypothetical protein MES4922_230228 [Mesorhizobium ventifaucium]|uniref:Uncharacterized protein n=1 Tax=Mesorhizobium ventifaucium TaxID=666020 RepID=A0ABM9DU79_9HYPH|nr:hypothetical protein MES4922_230228 [Mesorhizobium ventifaucium]